MPRAGGPWHSNPIRQWPATTWAAPLTAARQLPEAVDLLRRAIALRPDFAEAWYNLASALKEQGKYGEAAAACRRALALRPERVEAHVNLGNILQAAGQQDEAIVCYRRALELRPNDVEALSNLGNALRSCLQIDAAIAAFRKCISLRPDFHVAYCNLGNALKDSGRIDEAIQCFRRAVEICPSDVISHSNLAYSVYYHPDYDSAAILAENRRWNDAADRGTRCRFPVARQRRRSRAAVADRLRRRRLPGTLPIAVHDSPALAPRPRSVRDLLLCERAAAGSIHGASAEMHRLLARHGRLERRGRCSPGTVGSASIFWSISRCTCRTAGLW